MNWQRFFRRDATDSEQRKELEFYIDVAAEEYTAQGMDPVEARAAARKKLGNITIIREEIYQMNTLTFVENALRDIRRALRVVRTKPGFSLPALLSLALGLGANIAIFSVVNAVLIKPLPYPEPDKLIGVYNSAVFSGEVFKEWPLSLNMYSTYERSAQTFREFGVWTPEAATVTGIGAPERVKTVAMTYGVLRALGTRPYLGRWFSKEDDLHGAQETAIVSHGYWQRKLGGSTHALGRMVLIDFVPYQVVGVMPANFKFLDQTPDILLSQNCCQRGAGVERRRLLRNCQAQG